MVIDVLEREELPFQPAFLSIQHLPITVGIADDVKAPTYAELYSQNHETLHLVGGCDNRISMLQSSFVFQGLSNLRSLKKIAHSGSERTEYP